MNQWFCVRSVVHLLGGNSFHQRLGGRGGPYAKFGVWLETACIHYSSNVTNPGGVGLIPLAIYLVIHTHVLYCVRHPPLLMIKVPVA